MSLCVPFLYIYLPHAAAWGYWLTAKGAKFIPWWEITFPAEILEETKLATAILLVRLIEARMQKVIQVCIELHHGVKGQSLAWSYMSSRAWLAVDLRAEAVTRGSREVKDWLLQLWWLWTFRWWVWQGEERNQGSGAACHKKCCCWSTMNQCLLWFD
jgi:hypothetical protein